MGSVGDAYDNALAESFVDSFKTELIWRDRAQLELAIVEWVAWFNDARLHESLGDIPPAEFEAQHAPAVALRATAITRWLRLHDHVRNPNESVSVEPGPAQPHGHWPAWFTARECVVAVHPLRFIATACGNDRLRHRFVSGSGWTRSATPHPPRRPLNRNSENLNGRGGLKAHHLVAASAAQSLYARSRPLP